MRNVSKRYGGVTALSNIDFSIDAGEVHCLLGENGSGKSTLIKIMTGVERADPGSTVEIDGASEAGLSPMRAAAHGIQVIYQDLSVFPNLTVAENIASGQLLSRRLFRDRAAVRRIAEAAIAKVAAPLDPDARVADLGIAKRQLVAICRAVSAEARLIIMDEPTASLTAGEVRSLLALIKSLRDRGVAILFVSHKLDEVMAVAERVTVLRDGQMMGTFAMGDLDADRLSVLITGRSFQYQSPVWPRPDQPPVLGLRGLSRSNEFSDISLDLHPGEILGVAGLLGSGRTELALSMFGITRPDSGSILIDGQPVTLNSNRDAIARGIAYVPEDRVALGLVMPQSIGDNIVLTILDRLRGAMGLMDGPGKRRTADDWRQRLAIKAADSEVRADFLSGGNQQRVVLAKWMARAPRVLILDSPTVGVDVNAKDGIYQVIRALAAQGVAIILISDELDESLLQSHRVMVMKGGRAVGEFTSAEVTAAEIGALINA